jgi:hypothetical protein
MRTTVTLDDNLLATAKRIARRRGVALGRVIEDALRLAFARGAATGDRPAIPVFTGGTGPRPGVDLTSNRALYEALDEGQALDQLR